MRKVAIVGLLLLMLTGCAISGRGNFPHPVWIWECWWGSAIC